MQQSETRFASAAREKPEEIRNLIKIVEGSPLVGTLLEAVHGYLLLVNRQRQVLAANQSLLRLLGKKGLEELTGRRPGEVFNCIHAEEEKGGCGTSNACRKCGAVLAILHSQAGQRPIDGECDITLKAGNDVITKTFSLRAAPLNVGEHLLTVVTMIDIGPLRTRRLYDRLFLRDILERIGSLQTWIETIDPVDSEEERRFALQLSEEIVRELADEDLLRRAEEGELKADPSPVPLRDLCVRIEGLFKAHGSVAGRSLDIRRPPDNLVLLTDFRILLDVLRAMIENALEATPPGETARLETAVVDGTPRFTVSNDLVIPEDVLKHLYQRGFSTKRNGRGTGTYGMKLLAEKILGGTISHVSTRKKGTAFTLSLPAETLLEGTKWIHPEEPPAVSAVPDITLPSGLIHHLNEAARLGEPKQIQRLCLLVEAHCPPLAHLIHELAGLYRYDDIRSLLPKPDDAVS